MAITNYTDKEVQFKIVLYGPPFSGKSSTLAYIHSRIESESKGDLTELKSAADRTLTFDYVAPEAVLLEEFKIRFELFTVPGNVLFNAPRKLVLRDADGILFIADSQWAKMEDNVLSFKNLEDNLRKLGVDFDQLPLVLQYNKRDLPEISPVSYLDFVLNNRKTRSLTVETVATTGGNILPALRKLSHAVIQKFIETSPGESIGAHAGISFEG